MKIKNTDGSFQQRYTCEPGSLFNDYCNTCICSQDGKPGTCTKKNCDKTVFNRDGTLKTSYNVIRPARSGIALIMLYVLITSL